MAKAKKREPLVVGQRVWIETVGYYDRGREIREYEVIEANSSSAYIVRVDIVEQFKANPVENKYSKIRVKQANYDVETFSIGYSKILWLSKEAFERNVQYNKEVKELRSRVTQLVSKMNVEELRKVLEII